MESVFGIQQDQPYTRRIAELTGVDIALWDVLKHCERVGSLDARINVSTEEPNALVPFLEEHRSIRRIVLNGNKAAQSYRRLIAPTVPDSLARRVEVTVAPSTSPANARETRESLTNAWKTLLKVTA
jgi:hypoxanthine-DNA glycosylase